MGENEGVSGGFKVLVRLLVVGGTTALRGVSAVKNTMLGLEEGGQFAGRRVKPGVN